MPNQIRAHLCSHRKWHQLAGWLIYRLGSKWPLIVSLVRVWQFYYFSNMYFNNAIWKGISPTKTLKNNDSRSKLDNTTCYNLEFDTRYIRFWISFYRVCRGEGVHIKVLLRVLSPPKISWEPLIWSSSQALEYFGQVSPMIKASSYVCSSP